MLTKIHLFSTNFFVCFLCRMHRRWSHIRFGLFWHVWASVSTKERNLFKTIDQSQARKQSMWRTLDLFLSFHVKTQVLVLIISGNSKVGEKSKQDEQNFKKSWFLRWHWGGWKWRNSQEDSAVNTCFNNIINDNNDGETNNRVRSLQPRLEQHWRRLLSCCDRPVSFIKVIKLDWLKVFLRV